MKRRLFLGVLGASIPAAILPARAQIIPGPAPTGNGSMTFQAGRFYTSSSIANTAATTTFSTTSLIAGTPIYVASTITLQTLSCDTAGTVAGTAHARMALYTDAGGLPGVPVAGTDTGDLTQTASGVLSSANLGASLAPGWYWPVWESSGLAGGTLYTVIQGRPNAQMGGNNAAGLIANGYRTLLMTHTYGTALPAWATSSEGIGSEMPVIALGF